MTQSKMNQLPVDPEELRLIRTCFAVTPDQDTVAVFVIDGRRYTDPREVRRAYDHAWDEMSWRGAYEWETHAASMTESPSRLPSWEEFQRDLDDRYPILGSADS